MKIVAVVWHETDTALQPRFSSGNQLAATHMVRQLALPGSADF
jgi:hypothetical protein